MHEPSRSCGFKWTQKKKFSYNCTFSLSPCATLLSAFCLFINRWRGLKKKRKKESVKRLIHFTDRNVILKFSFSKAAVSYLHENRSENPQHGDLEDSDSHHGAVYNQKNTSQIVKRRKMPFSLSVQLRAKLLVSTKAHYLYSVFSNNLIIMMTSTGKLLLLLRPVS